MPRLRAELETVLARLTALSAETLTVELDLVGETIGALEVSTEEIEALFTALEGRGRTICSPTGKGAEMHLGRVVGAARTLKTIMARRPTLDEVATHAELTRAQVLLALALLRVMQR